MRKEMYAKEQEALWGTVLNENSLHTVLPVMLSSKLLPEMETDDNTKREQLLHGMQSLPVAAQIEKLKVGSHTTYTTGILVAFTRNDLCIRGPRLELI